MDDCRRHRVAYLGLIVGTLIVERRHGLLRLVVDFEGRLQSDHLVVLIWYVGSVVCGGSGDLRALGGVVDVDLGVVLVVG